MVLFATFLFWHELSKTYIKNHAFPLQNFGIFHLKFGGKITIWKIGIAFTSNHVHLAQDRFCKWFSTKTVHCSIHFMHMRWICKIGITPSFHLIHLHLANCD
jgi:hypothetical protein